MCIIKGMLSLFSHEMLYKMKCGRPQQKEIAWRFHEKAYWAFEMWQVIGTFKKKKKPTLLHFHSWLPSCLQHWHKQNNMTSIHLETIASAIPGHLVLCPLFHLNYFESLASNKHIIWTVFHQGSIVIKLNHAIFTSPPLLVTSSKLSASTCNLILILWPYQTHH